MSKRFVMGGDTHILDTKTNEEYYAPCETELLDLLNEQQTEITELKEAIDYLKTVIRYTIPNQMVADVFKYIGEDYEETCLKYEKTIRDLKDGTYKEPLPITQRK